MSTAILIGFGVILFAFTEWIRHEMDQEKKARMEYVKQKQNTKTGFCSECYFHTTVEYIEEENLWVCKGCK